MIFNKFKVFGVKCFPFVIYIIISIACGFACFNLPEHETPYRITSVEEDAYGGMIAKVEGHDQKIPIETHSYSKCKPNCAINLPDQNIKLQEVILVILSVIFGFAGFIGFLEFKIN